VPGWIRRRPVAGAAVVLGGLVAAAGCASDAPQDTWQPAGDNAQKIHNLQWPVFLIAGIVFVLVAAAIGWAVFRYRDRGQPIPKQTHGRPVLEIGMTVLPAIILIGIAIPTVGTLFALARTDDTECFVNVTGNQWWWEMDYPVQEGCGGIATPIVTSGQLVIPVETNVLVRGTSRDVIHSFWIPRLNGKKDMVPGRVQTVRLEADEPGIYAGQCAEFCGLSHSLMRARAVAVTEEEFSAWISAQQQPAAQPAEGSEAAAGLEVFLNRCTQCHTVDPFNVVALDQFSGPDLTHFMSRDTIAGGALEYSPENLTRWLANPPEVKPGSFMPDLGLTQEEIDSLIAFLETLE
jgi:cytochrome c oxidase subunit 2